MLANRRTKKGAVLSTTRWAGSNQATQVSGSIPGRRRKRTKAFILCEARLTALAMSRAAATSMSEAASSSRGSDCSRHNSR